MVWANLRVPSCAAALFGKTIWPLTAIKNAGLESKYLIQAMGPSWVTEWETVCMNARTAWSTEEAPSGVTEWEWLAPAAPRTQTTKVADSSRERIRNLRERNRTGRTQVEDDIATSSESPSRKREV